MKEKGGGARYMEGGRYVSKYMFMYAKMYVGSPILDISFL